MDMTGKELIAYDPTPMFLGFAFTDPNPIHITIADLNQPAYGGRRRIDDGKSSH